MTYLWASISIYLRLSISCSWPIFSSFSLSSPLNILLDFIISLSLSRLRSDSSSLSELSVTVLLLIWWLFSRSYINLSIFLCLRFLSKLAASKVSLIWEYCDLIWVGVYCSLWYYSERKESVITWQLCWAFLYRFYDYFKKLEGSHWITLLWDLIKSRVSWDIYYLSIGSIGSSGSSIDLCMNFVVFYLDLTSCFRWTKLLKSFFSLKGLSYYYLCLGAKGDYSLAFFLGVWLWGFIF